jgi:predicted NUDIX family phosphoesterase
MGKLALCVDKTAIWSAGILGDISKPRVHDWKDAVLDAPARLIDRDICEHDPSTLQLIPYILVTAPGDKVFCYSRGAKSGEDRLKAKLSIGLGGHVDRNVGENESLYMLLLAEAARELEEEIGINVEPLSELELVGIIHEEMSEVGKVHLGLLVHYEMTDEEFQTIKLEEGHIEDAKFVQISDLLAVDTYERLELWSRAVVDSLAHYAAVETLNLHKDV